MGWLLIALAVIFLIVGQPSPHREAVTTSASLIASSMLLSSLAGQGVLVAAPIPTPTTGPITSPITLISTMASSPNPTPTSLPPASPLIYTVQPGDTLGAIAVRYGIPLQTLIAVNGIENPDVIWVGQVLTLPTETSQKPPEPASRDERPASISSSLRSALGPDAQPTTAKGGSSRDPEAIVSLPLRALLSPMSHEWQRMNNCAPATVAMALSFYGERFTQFDLAPVLKGGEQDKNVSPEEIVGYLHEIGYGGRVQVNGDLDTVQRLIAHGIPVIVEQWLERPDDELTGHYRLVRGYDRAAGTIIVNDSYNGPQRSLSLAEFDRLWRAFHRVYIPVYRLEDEPMVRQIIGAAWDEQIMYRRAAEVARQEVETIGDLYAWFNLGDSLLGLGRAEEAVSAFERAMALGLPPRLLWYRFGPLEAYNRAGQYPQTLDLAAPLLAKVPMLEEAQYQRGFALEGLGRKEEAIAAYELALRYNPRLEEARQALARVQIKAGGAPGAGGPDVSSIP
ncbi:MAG: C39 family peptidase [Anaerolineae bacterium]|nr:C39 family peptidase [Anaerolineae bacterium]